MRAIIRRPVRSAPPALCLAGLTRNARDFHDLALALSAGEFARPVWALDTRGRGLSEFDPDWKNYIVPIEMLDVQDLVAMAGLWGARVIGTSRGGIIAMVLAAAQPAALGAVVLNDIGPVIEQEGLIRISTYVGRMPLPTSWDEATSMVTGMSRASFPGVPEHVWADVARAWYSEKDGRPAPGYDPAIGRAMSVKDGPIPALWSQFTALRRHPLLVVRGETSDILSEKTLNDMQRRHANFASITVPGEGHAPLLKDALTIGAIQRFLATTDT
jgi:pimeloyl-ACP methyl ester carboxylesterase